MSTEKYRKVNEIRGWIYDVSPSDGKDYFIAAVNPPGSTMPDPVVTVAIADPMGANGWTNGDTWEDFHNTVVAYMPMTFPVFKS